MLKILRSVYLLELFILMKPAMKLYWRFFTNQNILNGNIILFLSVISSIQLIL